MLAYLDTFDAQSSTVYTGTLEANDSRLIAAIAGKSTLTLDAEVVLTVGDAERQIFPNLPVTVQPPVISGPESSEGGPVFLNQDQSDARYVPRSGGTLDVLARITHANGSYRGAVPNGEGGELPGLRDVCSAEYIRDWSLGIEYFRNSDGTVNVAFSSFDTPPSASEDTTKGYVAGSYFVTKSGLRYIAIEVPTGEAIWESLSGYTIKTSSFTAEAGKAYALDTTEGSFDVTLPASWTEGQEIRFMDAKGTWNANPPTFLRNGNKIEGIETDYIDSAQGTFLSFVYVDSSQGVRILESGTKPHNLVLPSITGHYIGGSITGDNGTWTGAPFSYVYQHQISDDGSTGWADIEGATSSSYTPISEQETKFIRRGVAAVNANGTSAFAYSAASAALEVPTFPPGALAFWKLDDLTDASGNGHTLTNNNDVTFGAGKVGNCAQLDGFSNFLTGTGDFVFDGDFSFSLWCKINDAVDLGGNSFTQTGVFNCATEGDPFYGNITVTSYAGSLNFGTDLFGPIVNFNDISQPPNVWHHLVITRESGLIRGWIDGVLSGNTGTNTTTFGASGVLFGKIAGFYNQFAVDVDATGVWARALTDLEISTLYNSGDGAEPA